MKWIKGYKFTDIVIINHDVLTMDIKDRVNYHINKYYNKVRAEERRGKCLDHRVGMISKLS